MRSVATTAEWERLWEYNMKVLNTTESAGEETLCALYAELVLIRHEVNQLERAKTDIPPDSQVCHREAGRTESRGKKRRH